MGRKRFGHIGTKVKDITQTNIENSGVFDIHEVSILTAEGNWRTSNAVNCDYIVVAGGGGGGGGRTHHGVAYHGGGGGAAGGYREDTSTGLNFNLGVTYAISIGGGGGGGNNSDNGTSTGGSKGNNTTVAHAGGTFSATGGGLGGSASGLSLIHI